MSKKISSVVSIVLATVLIFSAVFSAFQILPKTYGASTFSDSVLMSPMTQTLPTLPTTTTYFVNVSSTGTGYLNAVDILLPTGWTYTSGAIAYGSDGFAQSAAGGGWVNFTTTDLTFLNGAWDNFSIPVTISTVPIVSGTWTIDCYQASTPGTNPTTVTVAVNLEFHASMSPNYVMNGTSYVYTLTVTNDLCPIGINYVNITFPLNLWTFNVLVQYSPATWTIQNYQNNFTLTGPNILEGYSASILVNMTVPVTIPGTATYNWTVSAFSSSGSFLGGYTLSAVIDNSKPSISISAPASAYYSVGSGNYIWINVTVSDPPLMSLYVGEYVIAVNDTRFILESTGEVGTTGSYYYYYVNNTAIPNGPLSVLITAEDPAGNIGSATATATIDNTAPQLLTILVYGQNGQPLHQDASGTYWMQATTTNISVAAAFYNLATFSGTIYFNNTAIGFANSTNYPGAYVWLPGSGNNGYNVVGSNLVTVNITLTDIAAPTSNRFSYVWNVERELTPPSAPSYTKTQIICGGLIVYGLTATDAVGINNYNIYYNGTLYDTLYPDELNSSTLTWSGGGYFASVQGDLVMDLFDAYPIAGSVANVTIIAVDYGSNLGPPATILLTVPAGQWYPIEMYPGYNLISLPLLPNSTTTSNIFSLLLLNGASGVKFSYGYNSATQSWVINPPTMSDGNGYWVDMNGYDVLIVQGYPVSAPPGSPPSVVEYSLVSGWNLAGFTETDEWPGYVYVASLQSTTSLQSYYIYGYTWSAQYQQWEVVALSSTATYGNYYLEPGQGFFIYLYEAQTLIPPA